MSETPDAPGPGEPTPGPLPGDDFPAGFFDAAAEDRVPPPPIEAASTQEEPPGSVPAPGLDAPEPEAPESALIPESLPEPEPIRHPLFPVMLGACLIALMVIGAVLNLETPKKLEASTAASPAEPAPAEEPAKGTAVAALAGNVEALKSEIAGLSKQIQDLQGKVAAAPKLDLAPLEARVAQLAKASEAAAGLPQRVAALDARVGKFDQALERGLAAVRGDLDSLRGEVKRVGQAAESSARQAAARTSAPATTAASPAPRASTSAEDRTVSRLAELFKAGKYKEASDSFRTAEPSHPKDARAWYYAALSSGLATNQWQGEAERLVKQGVEREKAGSPRPSEVDSEFAGLSPAGLRAWLDYYRKNASK